MFSHLQISDRRERWLVGLADAALGAAMVPVRLVAPRRIHPAEAGAAAGPRRILILRLERIGDLLMARPALAAVRHLAPGARIDLVVGSWNEALARVIGDVDRVRVLDAKWLARGAAAPSWPALIRQARAWRDDRYDLALNFEGDIRSHLLMAQSGAPRRVGFDMAGGGPLLTDRVAHDSSRHVADNLLRLVETAFGQAAGSQARVHTPLNLPEEARERARALVGIDHRRMLIGIQVGGGRPVKQWEPRRFGDLAGRLAAKYGATIVFTGDAADRPLVDAARASLAADVPVVDLAGRADLLTLAAVLEMLAIFITGDTGLMHLASAVNAPLVAIFGPSDPRRWGPLSPTSRVVRSDVPCGPCNRIRRPPAACVGVIPECLAAIGVAQVQAEAERLLEREGGGDGR